MAKQLEKITRKPKREPLSRERIVDASLILIEQDGLDDFSIRKLAQALKCEAMSLYHHFPSKAHLMDALVDRVIAEAKTPDKTLEVFEQLRLVALEFRGIGLRYPQFFKYLALHRMNTPDGIRFLTSVITIFFEAGFDAESSARLFRSFSYYLVGATLDETSGYAKGPSAVEPVSDEVIMRDYPNLAKVGVYFKPGNLESTFNWGLDMFIEGFKMAQQKLKVNPPV